MARLDLGKDKGNGKSIQLPTHYGLWITIMNDNRNIELIPSHENFDYYLPCDIMIHLHTAPIPFLLTKQTLKLIPMCNFLCNFG